MPGNASWPALVLLAGVAACDTVEQEVAEVDPPRYAEGLGTAENPIPQDNVAYTVRSRIEPEADATVPPQVASVVESLRAFSQSPAQTLLALADGAGLPELAQLYSAVPSSLMQQLPGWIDAELDTEMIGGKTVRSYASTVSSFVETALTRFGLESTLSFTPAHTAHTLTGIMFQLGGLDVVVPIGGLKADVIEQQMQVSVAEAGLITFGEHEFGVAFGEHAWHGVSLASTALFGAAPRTAIVGAIDCFALSQVIASKCVDDQCVGHQSEINTICERSLDLLVTDLGTRVATFDSDVVRNVAGTARLVDENHDGLANRIADGIWSSELVLGPARGTFIAFTGER